MARLRKTRWRSNRRKRKKRRRRVTQKGGFLSLADMIPKLITAGKVLKLGILGAGAPFGSSRWKNYQKIL